MNDQKVLFESNSLEELANAFADEACRKYLNHLEFWHSTAVDDKKEYFLWEKKIQSEPQQVREAALNRILWIINNPHKNRRYFKRKFLFRDYTVISIVPSSGFYNGLLNGKDISYAFSANVEYIINLSDFTLIKKIYSQFTRL